MSLINEALKKAQRERTEEIPNPSAPTEGGGAHIPKRGKAHSANTMVLAGGGAIVLVVISVLVTVFLLNRPDPATTPAPTLPATAPSTAANSPTPTTPTI